MRCRTFHALAIIGVCVALAAGVVLFILRPTDVVCNRVVFKGARGELVGDVYRPAQPASKILPGVLICHGVENNKEVTSALAIEFARRGFVALTFDYGGYGESTHHDDKFDIMVGDTIAALAKLANLLDVDRSDLAIVGHSMGVSYALDASMIAGDAVRAIVGLGNEAVAPHIPPRNLLLAMGLYDAFHSIPQMLNAVRSSADIADLEPGRIAGDIGMGSARGLIISPISDHGMEPLDPLLIANAIGWVESSIYVGKTPQSPVIIKETYRAEARLVLLFSSFLSLVGLLVLLYVPLNTGASQRLILRLPLFLIMALAVLGNVSSPTVALACADATMVIFMAGSVAAHLALSSKSAGEKEAALSKSSHGMAFGAAILAAAAVSLLAGLLIHGLPMAFSRAEWAKAIPQFLFHVFLLRPYEGWCMLRAYAFSAYSQGWVPGIWFGALIVVEAIRPGAVTYILGKVAHTLVKAFKLRGPFKLRASGRSWAVLAAAVVALILIIGQRLREGWLSGEAVKRMAIIGLKFMVIPLIIFILLLNLPLFSRGFEKQ